MSNETGNSSGSKTEIYNVKFYFRGRRIAEENEPPANLIDDFLEFLANGLVQREWDESRDSYVEHDYCTDECAIETCIIMGRPYTSSLRAAMEP